MGDASIATAGQKKGVDTESKAGKDEKGALQRDEGGGGVASVLMLMSD